MLTPGINSLPFWEKGIKFFIIEATTGKGSNSVRSCRRRKV